MTNIIPFKRPTEATMKRTQENLGTFTEEIRPLTEAEKALKREALADYLRKTGRRVTALILLNREGE